MLLHNERKFESQRPKRRSLMFWIFFKINQSSSETKVHSIMGWERGSGTDYWETNGPVIRTVWEGSVRSHAPWKVLCFREFREPWKRSHCNGKTTGMPQHFYWFRKLWFNNREVKQTLLCTVQHCTGRLNFSNKKVRPSKFCLTSLIWCIWFTRR